MSVIHEPSVKPCLLINP